VLCLHCPCSVEGVQGYTRNIFDRQIYVPPFFRLPKNAEGSGAGHSPRCRFNVTRTIIRFVAKSREVENFKAEPILVGHSNGAEYRLHILVESFWLAQREWETNSETAGSEEPRTGIKLVFPGRGGRPIDVGGFTQGVFKRSLELAQMEDFTWHDLRHTFASRLVMKGVDLRTVQELMGHKTIQMTLRYAHLAPGHLAEAVQRLSGTNTSTAPQSLMATNEKV
jgi:hypothetical protein